MTKMVSLASALEAAKFSGPIVANALEIADLVEALLQAAETEIQGE